MSATTSEVYRDDSGNPTATGVTGREGRFDFGAPVSVKVQELIARMRVMNEGAFDALRDPEWLIRKTIPIDGLGVTFGEPKSEKSYIMLDQALSVAAGLPDWCGRRIMPLRDDECVVYVAAEGARGMRVRKKAWMQAHNVTSIPRFHVVGHTVNMSDPDNVEALARKIHSLGIRPRWIIIDTLARNFGSGNENQAQDMNLFVQGCDSLFQLYFEDLAVTVVHHCGKDKTKGGRGSNALFGALDAEHCTDKKSDGSIVYKNTAMKDAREQPPLAFRLVTVEGVHLDAEDVDDADKPVVLRRTELPANAGEDAGTRLGEPPAPRTNAEKLLAVLQDLGRDADPITYADWQRRAYALYNVPRGSFQRPYSALLNERQVEEVSEGRYRLAGPRTIGAQNRRVGRADTSSMDRCPMGSA